MGVNSLPKTVTRQRRGCDLNPGPSAPESSTLTTLLPRRNRERLKCGKTHRRHGPRPAGSLQRFPAWMGAGTLGGRHTLASADLPSVNILNRIR